MESSHTVMKPLKAHLRSVKPSATLLINERSARLIAEGKKVYRLGFGQSPFPVPDLVVEALKQHADQKDYLPVLGLPALRQAVAEHAERTLGISAEAEQIMIGPGSKELIFGAQLALDCNLLLPSPSWVSYEPQAKLADKKTIWLSTNESDNWLLNPEALNIACLKNPGAGLLILNYPNNPTGTTFSSNDFEALASVLRRHNVIVIADEIYGEVTHDGNHESLAKYYPEGTIISSGLSKWCGAGGWRLGTFIFPKELFWLRDAISVIASETFSSVNAPAQYAAVAAYTSSQKIDTYLKDSRAVLSLVGNFVFKTLQSLSISCPPPQGGFYLFPNFEHYRSRLNKKDINTGSQLCEYLLTETGIALLPGSAFGRPEEELTARLAYVDFDGREALRAFKTEGPKTDFIKSFCPQIFNSMQALSVFFKN